MLANRTIVRRGVNLPTLLLGIHTRSATVMQPSHWRGSIAPSSSSSSSNTLVQGLRNTSHLKSRVPHIIKAAPDLDNMMMKVIWSEGGEDRYPFIWMRDNCPCPACFHSTAKNRQLSIGQLCMDINPSDIEVNNAGNKVKVHWSDDHVSSFGSSWLHDRAFNTKEHIKRKLDFRSKISFWGNEKQGHLRQFPFGLLKSDDSTLLAFLEVLEEEGVAVIHDVPPQADAFERLTRERIGYVRPTHYGETFAVRSKKDASNVAYTNKALDMHNDMVYLQEKPGIQIMHCISQTKEEGGDHLLVDSFNVAKQMQRHHPELFRVLSRTVITFIDTGFDAVGYFNAKSQHPTIQCDEEGNIIATNISNHSRDSFLYMTPEETVTWYKAYLTFRDLLYDPKNYIINKLQTGEMVVIDNTRVLHGRTAYQDSEGERHMVSGYWDWDAVNSRRRVLQSLSVPREGQNQLNN